VCHKVFRTMALASDKMYTYDPPTTQKENHHYMAFLIV
jgi:hypothetical protein